MLKIENFEVMGWEHAIRGMRNPKNSWDKSDSYFTKVVDCETDLKANAEHFVGENDHKLMMSLAKGGPVHAKYRRMITVYLDITAPLYWWKEFDTYKVGTVANSCSTMHKIHAKEFERGDFSNEHLLGRQIWDHDPKDEYFEHENTPPWTANALLNHTINMLNHFRKLFLETGDKKYWWQMIQLLPTSYNQKRTVMLNYEVLHNIYHSRKNHKLDEWHVVCDWIKELPYSELITGEWEDQ